MTSNGVPKIIDQYMRRPAVLEARVLLFGVGHLPNVPYLVSAHRKCD